MRCFRFERKKRDRRVGGWEEGRPVSSSFSWSCSSSVPLLRCVSGDWYSSSVVISTQSIQHGTNLKLENNILVLFLFPSTNGECLSFETDGLLILQVFVNCDTARNWWHSYLGEREQKGKTTNNNNMSTRNNLWRRGVTLRETLLSVRGTKSKAMALLVLLLCSVS